MFQETYQIPCNFGTLSIFQHENKYWFHLEDIIKIIIYFQQQNIIYKKNGETMITLELVLFLLNKFEMDDFSISTTINALKTIEKNKN